MIRIITPYLLLFLLLILFTACSPLEVKHSKALVIEDFRTGQLLWKSHVRQGDIIHYNYVHSVYRDRVYQTYEISEEGHFILTKVASTPTVLSLPYPGFELSLSLEESSQAFVEIELHRVQQQILMVVGGEHTDNRMTIGQQTIHFRDLVGQGAIVRMRVHQE